MEALKSGSDVLFVLLGGIMVLAMHAGFAFLELGTVRKKITIHSNDPKRPELALFLTGEVLPRKMEAHQQITLAPKDKLVLFKGQCATCHVPPLFMEPGWPMHTAEEIGIDDFQSSRSPDQMYRTAPLAGLWTHTTGGFYHDGRFPTLQDVIGHYNVQFSLGLTADGVDTAEDDVLHRAGVDIRPEAMGVTWDDVRGALLTLPAFVVEAGLWFTIASVRPPDDALVDELHSRVTARYGPWDGPA